MTKTDYKTVAGVLRRTRKCMDGKLFLSLVTEFAEEFALHNAQFNKQAFKDACYRS